MHKQACVALSVGALIFYFGGQAQAGWGGSVASSLTVGVSRPIVFVKRNKNADDDNHHKAQNQKAKRNKNKHDEDDTEEAKSNSGSSGNSSSGSSGNSSSGGSSGDVPAATLLLPGE